MSNKIIGLFQSHKKNLLSIYLTAGYPTIDAFREILEILAESDVDILEIGIPFSDPMADGEIIRKSHEKVLRTGLNLPTILEILSNSSICEKKPVYLMGYLNPFFNFDLSSLVKKCSDLKIDGLIIPDLPYSYYSAHYHQVFNDFHVLPMFLISPATHSERMEMIYNQSAGPVYMVSSFATTGNYADSFRLNPNYTQSSHYSIWKEKTLFGFGIHNHDSFRLACQYARGGIVGSSFIQALSHSQDYKQTISEFIRYMRNGK